MQSGHQHTDVRGVPGLLMGALLVLLGVGCADQAVRQTQNFDRPVDMAYVCYEAGSSDSGGAVPALACDSTRHDVYGFVANTERGDIAVLNLVTRQNIDVNAAIPGYTRAPIGSLPAVVVAHPSSRWVFVANQGSDDLARLTTAPGAGYEVRSQSLPGHPYDLVIGRAPWALDGEWPPARPDVPDDPTDPAADDAILSPWEQEVATDIAAQPWVAYVSLPQRSSVVLVPLDDEGFGELQAADMQAITLTGGAPARLQLSDDGRTLFATHLDRGYVSKVDLTTGAEERIWLAVACADGQDNDGDGLADADDPGCWDRGDDDESDDPATTACSNGVDDDDDGLVDMDDPGCRHPADASEISDAALCATSGTRLGCLARSNAGFYVDPPSCDNGIDDDGDGLVDEDDSDDCPSPYSTGETLPACSNGVDDDGDGLADLDDPGCYRRDGETEEDPQSVVIESLAVSAADEIMYVLDTKGREVLVIDLDTGERLDVLAGDLDLGGQPVLRRQGRRGIPLSSALRDVAFMDVGDDGLTGYVANASGGIHVIEARRAGTRCPDDEDTAEYRHEPRVTHRTRGVVARNGSVASQPVLYRGDEEIDLAFATIPSFPSMGSFRIDREEVAETDEDTLPPGAVACGDENETVVKDPFAAFAPEEPRTYYGVEFTEHPRQQLSETWVIRYEGVLPGTERSGRLLDDMGNFHDPGADYCALGVEPGDLLLIRAESPVTCSDDDVTFEGDRFEWPIVAVTTDGLLLGEGGRSYVKKDDADVAPDEPRWVVTAEGLPLPTPLACFGGPLDYEIRASSQYVVTGTRTGFAHNWTSRDGECVLREDADERFTGRTSEARLAQGAALDRCPPEATEYETKFEGDHFANFSFRVRLYPGCERRLDGTVNVLQGVTERDVAWQFNVTSGFAPITLSTGYYPLRLRPWEDRDARRMFVVDSSGEAVFEVFADPDSDLVGYTYF